MNKILLILTCVVLVSTLSGCLTLEIGLNEDGFSIGLKGKTPDIPNFDYKKDLFREE